MLQVVLGHGSGSFGHWEASQHATHKGVTTPAQWGGFAKVSAAALQLNRLVVDSFIDAEVPLLSLQPSASALADDGVLIRFELDPLRRALAHGLVPLVFGDVTFDARLGGTILSTEDIFVYLAERLQPDWIFLLGNAPGVLDGNHQLVPLITPRRLPMIRTHLRRSGYTDVTGGMADKVERMLALVENRPDLRVRILTGAEPGNLEKALLDPANFSKGTLICADSEGA